MQQLWAPWRKAYLRPKGRRRRGCLFCGLLAQRRDAENYILKRTPFSFALLNRYPYNNGHLMVVPLRHVSSVARLKEAEKLDWLALYEEMQLALQEQMRPDGFNVGLNLGKVAGAGVRGHLHLHVVPRWQGDSNFLPVIGHTKVIPESLDSVYRSLKRYLQAKKKEQK